VERIMRRDIPYTQTFVGHVEGQHSAEVHAQVSGILQKRVYKEGESVAKGQVLFEIDPAPYQAQVDQALGRVNSVRARLANAQRDMERAIPLARRNSISQREKDMVQAAFDAARAEMEEAQAALRAARIQLDLTRVRAPIAGFASMALRTEGSLITAGAPNSLLTTVNNMDTVQVVFSVSDSLVRRIKGHLNRNRATMGKTVAATLVIDGDHPYPHEGTLAFGNPVINRDTGSMIGKALFPNPDRELLPGQVVRLNLHLMTFRNALAVPQHAVLQTDQGSMVAVVDEEDRVSFRPISVAAILDREFLIDTGLTGNERVVVEGVNKIAPGMKVIPHAADNGTASHHGAGKG